MQYRQFDVFGTEIVTPLRYAVRFVDGKQRDLRRFQQFQAAWRHQPLRRNIHQVQFTVAHTALGAHRFIERLR